LEDKEAKAVSRFACRRTPKQPGRYRSRFCIVSQFGALKAGNAFIEEFMSPLQGLNEFF